MKTTLKLLALSIPFFLFAFKPGTKNKPDLIISEVHRPEVNRSSDKNNPYPNYDSKITVSVKNIGKAKSLPTTLKVWDMDITVKEGIQLGLNKNQLYFIEEDIQRGEEDEYFELVAPIPEINPGEVYKAGLFVKHWVYDPNCEMGAFIDPENVVAEKNEENNKGCFVEGGKKD
jgi:hypothetical protein